MEKNKFDDIVKAKLKELENSQSVESDWEYFSGLYDQAETGKDDLFDQHVSYTTNNYQVPYNQNHWVLMKEKLEKEEFIRTSIYFSKLVEAACVFLILFTFLNLFPKQSQESIDRDKSFAAEKTVEEIPVLVENLNFISSQTVDLPKNQFKQKNALNKSFIVKPLQFIPALNQKEIKTYNRFADGIPMQNEFIEEKTIKNKSSITDQSIKEKEVVALAALAEAPYQPLQFIRSFHYPITPIRHKQKSNSEKFLAFSVAPSINIVNSPYDFIYKTEPYTTDALGTEIGLEYSVRNDRIEVETGFRYAKKSYRPREIRETTGSFTTTYVTSILKDISFDILSIPLALKYHFKKTDQINLFAMAGSSINNVIYADYLIEQDGRRVNPKSRSVGFQGKTFNEGILNGGNYLDNLFISFDFGIGMEGKINDHTYFVIAPTIRQHIGLAGIGPNKDKVNALSLNLGIKKRL